MCEWGGGVGWGWGGGSGPSQKQARREGDLKEERETLQHRLLGEREGARERGQARGVWVRDYIQKHKEIERQRASQGSTEERARDERTEAGEGLGGCEARIA